MLRFGLASACVILLGGHIVDAQAQYKCTTKDGKVTYSDKPCAEAAGKGASEREIRGMTPPVPRGAGSEASTYRPPKLGSGPGVPGIDFPMFKKALDAGDGEGAVLAKKIAGGEDAQTMQRYAEAECGKGNKTACFAAYCGSEITDRPDYYSRKCADVMGRAHGANWMQVKAERPKRDYQGYENQYVACLHGDPAASDFASERVLIQCRAATTCRHNMAYPKDGSTSVTTMSDYFPSLKDAAEAGCKISGERVRRARGR